MGLDVRLPLGALFAILGALTFSYGLSHAYSSDVRWGGAMLAFGIVSLALAAGSAALERRKAIALATAPKKTE